MITLSLVWMKMPVFPTGFEREKISLPGFKAYSTLDTVHIFCMFHIQGLILFSLSQWGMKIHASHVELRCKLQQFRFGRREFSEQLL